MPLPIDYNTVTITGKYVYLNGTPVTGSIKFAGKVVATSVATNTIIVPTEILTELDENGSFSVPVPATDDPDINPNGWTYTITEQFTGGRTYDIDVPVAATVIDISTVAPATPASGDPTAFVTLSVFEEHTHEGGGGGGAVDSVNGQVGIVVLEADDVGAAPTVHTHAQSDVTGLATALSGKANTSHTHAIADTTGLQTALDTKAPLESPTFTGTITGITKAMVGLSNAENTSDLAKPISTATQTALDGKAAAVHTHTIANVTGLQTSLDGKMTGAASSTDNAVPRFDGTTGKVIQNSGVTVNDSNDVSGIRAMLRTYAADLGTDYLDRVDLNYMPAVDDMDLLRVYVQGALTTWFNEVMFLRGTPRSNYKDDALVRGRGRADLTTEQGGYIELENATSDLLHRRRWTDGALVRGDGSGASVVCSDVLVLGSGDPVPAGTPANTVIVRLS